MDLGMAGRKALVTGASRGIGRAIAATLAQEGCDLAICARGEGPLLDAAAELRLCGGRVFAAALDVAETSAMNSFIEQSAQVLEGIDIVVLNVSAMGGIDDSEEAWRRGCEIDILATVRLIHGVIPHLARSGEGAIVFIGSVGSVESVGPPRAYSAMKAAMVPYSKALAINLASKGVRSNMVSPGPIYFEGSPWQAVERDQPELFERIRADCPMGRMGRPEEIAAAVAFLASPRASFISGANLVCDGATTRRVQF